MNELLVTAAHAATAVAVLACMGGAGYLLDVLTRRRESDTQPLRKPTEGEAP